MSFGIVVAGKPAAVIKAVENAPGYGDTSQFDAVKEFICSELEAMPDTVTGVYVQANGHHDGHQRQLNIEIRPVPLAEDKE